MIALGPHILRRVELRRVPREGFDLQPGMGAKKRLDLSAPMDGPLIPQQDDRSADVVEQVLEEGADIQAGQVPLAKPEIQRDVLPPGRYREGTDRRDAIMFVEMVEKRRLAPRRPCAGDGGD